MTTTAEGLGDIIVALLKAAADAGTAPDGVTSASVFGIRAWPTEDDQLPQVQLALPEEDAQGMGRNGPWFTVVATLPLLITVQLAAAPDEEAAAQARSQLVDISRWIDRTVIGHPDLDAQVQRYAFRKAHGRVDAKGEEIAGQRVVMLGLEFLQQPEDFYSPDLDDLEEVDVFDPSAPDGAPGAERLKVVFGDGELDFTNPDNSGLLAVT